MANAVQMKQGDVATLESRLYEVAAGLKKSIRAIAASDTGVQADDEEETASEE